MVSLTTLKKLAKEHGTPLFVVDHDELRANYAMFKKFLQRVQVEGSRRTGLGPTALPRHALCSSR